MSEGKSEVGLEKATKVIYEEDFYNNEIVCGHPDTKPDCNCTVIKYRIIEEKDATTILEALKSRNQYDLEKALAIIQGKEAK